ncbi:DNA-binding response OmpR family regulator [Paenibacillus cellulosilyticus]|uniref:DNA-binding response OmpR family regulator n=1 Tax=Paenibacillus cellulosilyticus TaxID=375489 RepID=A0A2V2YQB6_9BACL|nr:response regulator transcription factor [Paenibacillus cellulosilyticus]PWV99312.1 DNA-binding response OmpR family regulator [Paenibacillus cellulosilyticus]QKS45077.1 response regulator transcription factor [Paenibacillus cellulosilyticus]
MYQLLIADDDDRMRKLLKDFLVRQQYTVYEADNGCGAIEMFHKISPLHLIILDVMMPKMDGWEVCRTIREKSSVPILMLTAKGEEYDELFGFQLGADDYIGKPFNPSILVARVGSLLRRSYPKQEESGGEWTKAGLSIHFAACRIYIDGAMIELSPREYDLLVFFVRNEGIVLSREQLLEKVWGFDYFGDLRTVDTHINRLRMKLSPYESYIQTIRAKGYRFEVNDEK